MDISTATILMVGAIFALLVTGLPLAFITGLVAMAFTFGWFGEAALPLVTSRVYGFITEYSLVAVPMFVLMASLLDRSGIAKDLFNAMRVFAGRLPGGVAVQTIVVALSVVRSCCLGFWRCPKCSAWATTNTSLLGWCVPGAPWAP